MRPRRAPLVSAALLILAALGGLRVEAQDVRVSASLDRPVVGLNQTFTLSVEVRGAALGDIRPELPSVGEFAAFLGQSSSQRFEWVNGRSSQATTYDFTFRATKMGQHEIGPVRVTVGGNTYSTKPVNISIRQGPPAGSRPGLDRSGQRDLVSDSELFVRVQADRTRVYQNEPVVVEFKIYTAVPVNTYAITTPPSTPGFWSEEFDIPDQPQTRSQIVNGRSYTMATIRKLALFPTSAGSKTVGPMTVDAEVRLRTRRTGRGRDPFDILDSRLFGSRTVPKSMATDPLEIEVLPFPQQGRPDNFSGVAGRLRIQARTDRSEVPVNQAVTYRLTVSGSGNLRTLPQPEIDFPDDFQVYAPKVSESMDLEADPISGRKVFEWVLVPREPGTKTLPAVQMAYFDPVKEQYQTVSSDPVEVEVTGSADGPVLTSGRSRGQIRQLRQDIRFIKTQDPGFRVRNASPWQSGLFWIVALAPLAALAGAFGYRRHSDRLSADVAYARKRRAGRRARKRLSRARSLQKEETQKEFYAEVARALSGFLGDKLNIAEAGMLSEQVKPQLVDKGASRDLVEEYFDCIRTCDLKRFSPSDATPAEMEQFIGRAEKAMTRLDREVKG
ncbi:MAG TPA: BatD family protein [Acidobacteriota bacterium]|nr:BatD family protein [Acidobacteriota bacterium]